MTSLFGGANDQGSQSTQDKKSAKNHYPEPRGLNPTQSRRWQKLNDESEEDVGASDSMLECRQAERKSSRELLTFAGADQASIRKTKPLALVELTPAQPMTKSSARSEAASPAQRPPSQDSQTSVPAPAASQPAPAQPMMTSSAQSEAASSAPEASQPAPAQPMMTSSAQSEAASSAPEASQPAPAQPMMTSSAQSEAASPTPQISAPSPAVGLSAPAIPGTESPSGTQSNTAASLSSGSVSKEIVFTNDILRDIMAKFENRRGDLDVDRLNYQIQRSKLIAPISNNNTVRLVRKRLRDFKNWISEVQEARHRTWKKATQLPPQIPSPEMAEAGRLLELWVFPFDAKRREIESLIRQVSLGWYYWGPHEHSKLPLLKDWDPTDAAQIYIPKGLDKSVDSTLPAPEWMKELVESRREIDGPPPEVPLAVPPPTKTPAIGAAASSADQKKGKGKEVSKNTKLRTANMIDGSNQTQHDVIPPQPTPTTQSVADPKQIQKLDTRLQLVEADRAPYQEKLHSFAVRLRRVREGIVFEKENLEKLEKRLQNLEDERLPDQEGLQSLTIKLEDAEESIRQFQETLCLHETRLEAAKASLLQDQKTLDSHETTLHEVEAGLHSVPGALKQAEANTGLNHDMAGLKQDITEVASRMKAIELLQDSMTTKREVENIITLELDSYPSAYDTKKLINEAIERHFQDNAIAKQAVAGPLSLEPSPGPRTAYATKDDVHSIVKEAISGVKELYNVHIEGLKSEITWLKTGKTQQIFPTGLGQNQFAQTKVESLPIETFSNVKNIPRISTARQPLNPAEVITLVDSDEETAVKMEPQPAVCDVILRAGDKHQASEPEDQAANKKLRSE
ncbi:uncharacterized protein E0L32_005722 [Thyridium curvatum]|uniref:Uncharacterized protein n=1 Tax=Thyridium curvatum TaxID=1093900 RepID=A0A507BAH2_9PEZI|nr:uncharacterized protein E0L32_005722 [Thyridium curvatum]TPX13778.1 hypothetical protein E0L32_005722 [Thyridium curvatum]